MQIPRPEHPRPQFYRDTWQNLNGIWQFEIDQCNSGIPRGLAKEGAELSGSITVPFCPESDLSGVGHKDFIYGVWYKRKIFVSDLSGRVFLHFGAVDYSCQVFVNGLEAGSHKGGYVSFSFEITRLLREGENEITLYATDDTRSGIIPSGKQCHEYHSRGCLYTRTTGIWQTVWLEFTPKAYIASAKYYPNVEAGSVTVALCLQGSAPLAAEVS